MSLLSLSRRFFLTKGETNRVRAEAFPDLLSITQIYLHNPLHMIKSHKHRESVLGRFLKCDG